MKGSSPLGDPLSLRALRGAIKTVVQWLSVVTSTASRSAVPEIDQEMQILLPPKSNQRSWEAIRQALFMQGLSPYLYEKTCAFKTWEQIPTEIQGWMEGEYARNTMRNQRIFNELVTLLRAARQSGIEVMALKGILLAKDVYPLPALRPMADMDLLVRSGSRLAMGEALENLGYTLIPSKSIYPNHDVYLNPGGEKVVCWSGEHPDNPRIVEVHEVVRRPLWGDVGTIDLTDALWGNCREDQIQGERIWVPDRLALLLHVCIHAMQHFMIETGRAIMWLDLGMLSPTGSELRGLDYPNLVYPVARLAQRALPGLLREMDLSELAQRVHPGLRRWCEKTPLDDSCGLTINNLLVKNRFSLMRARWNIRPWRMAIAYGDLPWSQALFQHASAFVRHIPKRVR